jgi:hypothetical protein
MIKIVGIIKQSTKLSNINLGNNQITLSNSNNLLELFKHTKIMLRLSLDHNWIGDYAVSIIEKYLFFSTNPPLE